MAAEKLQNVGPKSAAWLRQVGVRSLADLKELGAVGAFLKVKRAGFRPSLNLLYSLEGALLGCHWQQLPSERRSELLLSVDAADTQMPVAAGRAAGEVTDRSGPADDRGQLEPEPSFGFDDPAAEDSD
jgi:DNA transformation protein and related proteins